MDLLDLLRKVAEDAFKALSVVILFVKDSDARGVNEDVLHEAFPSFGKDSGQPGSNMSRSFLKES